MHLRSKGSERAVYVYGVREEGRRLNDLWNAEITGRFI